MNKRGKVKILSGDEVLSIHDELVRMFAADNDPISPSGPRSVDLIHSAAARPQTALGSVEKYQSIEHKAAALFHSLVRNHPFRNGNKRTALASLAIFLDRNDRRLTAEDDALFYFVMSVANRTAEFGDEGTVVGQIAQWIRLHMTTEPHEPHDMSINDFLNRCEQAGARTRQTSDGGSWLIIGPNLKSVRLSRSTRRLEGNAVKKYLVLLGMSEGVTGVQLSEFQEGLSYEQNLMRRFRNVLRRLALE